MEDQLPATEKDGWEVPTDQILAKLVNKLASTELNVAILELRVQSLEAENAQLRLKVISKDA